MGIATARHGMAADPDGIDPRQALATGGRDSLAKLHAPHVGLPAPDTHTFLERVAALSDAAAPSSRVVVAENTPLGLDGGRPGVDHVREALVRGAHVISANKSPAAFACRELMDVARVAKRHFLYEGAVLDGLPVFSLLRHTLPAVRIDGFRGIVNTTTNHILAAMEHGRPLDDALKDMQAAGVAGGRPITGHRWVGCSCEGCGTRQLTHGRRHHAARRHAHGSSIAQCRPRHGGPAAGTPDQTGRLGSACRPHGFGDGRANRARTWRPAHRVRRDSQGARA